jgi:hypothetical protein
LSRKAIAFKNNVSKNQISWKCIEVDDKEDLEVMKLVFASVDIKNEIITFHDPLKSLEFIRSAGSKTFFTLCDINMAPSNGLELKKIILFHFYPCRYG